MRNKTKSYNTFHPFLPSELNLILFLLSPPAQGDGEWGFWLVHHSLPLLSPLVLFSCSINGSLPQQTIPQEILQCEFSPQAAALHKLLYASHQVQSFRNRPVWVPHEVRSAASKPYVAMCSNLKEASMMPYSRHQFVPK